MINGRSICMAFFGMCAALAMGQWQPATGAELSRAIETNHKNYGTLTDFSLRYEMLHYEDQGLPNPSERHAMRIDRRGDSYRAEQLGILTIQDNTIRVSVDSTGAIVMLAAPSAMESEQVNTWKERIIPLATSIGKQMTPRGTRYRLMLPASTGFDAVEIAFDGAGWLQELVVLYAHSPQSQHLFTPAQLRPKVVTRFERPIALKTDPKVDMDPSKIVDLSGDTPTLRSKWKSYQLIDTRYR